MKATMSKTISLTLIILLVLIGCGEEEFVGQPGTDSKAPGVITDIVTEPIGGGAIIRYTPPNDEDFAYVEAVYYPNENTERRATSSKFIQAIKVDGFGTTDNQKAEIYAVDTSGNKSNAVTVEFEPLTPPHIAIFESLKVTDDFSGVLLDWDNEEEVRNIGITVLRHDDFGDFVPYDVVYDDANIIDSKYNVRGMDTVDVELGFYVKDRWGNQSDTLRGVFKPLFEVLIDHNNITPLELDTDIPTETNYRNGNYNIQKVADGKWGEEQPKWTTQNYHSEIADLESEEGLNYFPMHITLDLSVETLLSRIIFHSTFFDQYKQGGIKRFELYGTNDQSLIDRETNGAYIWPDGDDPNITGNWREEGMDGWQYIGEFETTKLSGLPGNAVAAGDREWARENPFEFNIDPGTSYRYIRFRPIELWEDGLKYMSMAEIQFFGAPKDK
ncbi:DUF4959 domain-containing protein [uncultured Algibacter sp.]|uniref:DUF4959 domain-containing protein n=1 Tax=uncultured Algibacter sp. TaxID=298659 RepID=UPI00261754F9|nr:DUF4959 domain-containing protein [uncultured Algibacter sp.]